MVAYQSSTGQLGFAVHGPRTGNRQPTALRSPKLTLSSFKRQLKTQLWSSSTRLVLAAAVRVSCIVVRRRRDCCEFGADYKCPDSTQLQLNRLSTYDFVLVFYSDLESRRNRCRVTTQRVRERLLNVQ